MICIKRVFETPDKAAKVKQAYHDALVGSPTYVNSEIAILDGDNPNEFTLVVGNSNSNNVQDTWVASEDIAPSMLREHITSRFSKRI